MLFGDGIGSGLGATIISNEVSQNSKRRRSLDATFSKGDLYEKLENAQAQQRKMSSATARLRFVDGHRLERASNHRGSFSSLIFPRRGFPPGLPPFSHPIKTIT